jgi:RNA polymerase sigma factor (TIGR02999 family)
MSDFNRNPSPGHKGDPLAAHALLPLVYQELRALAAARLRREKANTTLDPTGLVHEAYLRLAGSSAIQSWDSRGHFFAAAAEAMRRILIERARRRRSARKLSLASPSGLEFHGAAGNPGPLDILALNDALRKLESEHPSKAQIVKLRFFSGLSHEEIAAVLDLSSVTVKRHWRFARVWLHREMEAGSG